MPLALVPVVIFCRRDFRHLTPASPGAYAAAMRASGLWSAAGILLVSAALPIIVVIIGAPLLIPMWLWIGLYALVMGLALYALTRRPVLGAAKAAMVAAVVGSWAVNLTVGTGGLDFLAILLVFLAAGAIYVLPLPVVMAIVMVNSIVIGARVHFYDGSTSGTVIVVGMYVLIQLTAVASSSLIVREQRLRRELAVANTELSAASVMLADSTRTAERLRIARDLHDAIGHQLTVLSLELEAAKHRSGQDAADHVVRAGTVARELLTEVRETVGELRSEPADLRGVLDGIVGDIPGLQTQVTVADDVRIGEPERDALVRATQEIITNAIRHAEADRVWIDVSRDDDGGVVLRARDDGSGAHPIRQGNGLRGMTERFTALGGQVSLDGRAGFRVTARVPAAR